MRHLIYIFGDQLNINLSSLEGFDPQKDCILMAEVLTEATYVKHHKQKIALIFSAMRHFAQSLKEKNYSVIYKKLDEKTHLNDFTAVLNNVIQTHQPEKVILTEPSEYRVLEEVKLWQKNNTTLDIRQDHRFLATKAQFNQWANGRKQLRMEYFYRDMRRQYNILMSGDKPIGDQWNFDQENRQPPKAGLDIPQPFSVKPDAITHEVLELVENKFSDHFGSLDQFHMATTRQGALDALDFFIKHNLALFGTYQDAMLMDEPWLYHSHISFYLNCGLLEPLECVQAAEKAYHNDNAPINAVEGFIRQILGWREYIRGIYWHMMPDYTNLNFLNAKNPLPEFYWNAETDMRCLQQSVKQTIDHAYAHHIQRLMVLGNFALLVGIDPKYVNEWFLIVYADAYEWVELPNVSGMALFADGGVLGSKPYAASGAYINKMSNYCKHCVYKVSDKTGPTACPFNYLYWDFLDRNKEVLAKNPRMRLIYQAYHRMSDEKKETIKSSAKSFLKNIFHK